MIVLKSEIKQLYIVMQQAHRSLAHVFDVEQFEELRSYFNEERIKNFQQILANLKEKSRCDGCTPEETALKFSQSRHPEITFGILNGAVLYWTDYLIVRRLTICFFLDCLDRFLLSIQAPASDMSSVYMLRSDIGICTSYMEYKYGRYVDVDRSRNVENYGQPAWIHHFAIQELMGQNSLKNKIKR